MFSGIIERVAQVTKAAHENGALQCTVATGMSDLSLGESIAVNGVCLTAVRIDSGGFDADVSHETLRCTSGFTEGGEVNLERALRLSDRLGGHLVSGHVDGVGVVQSVEPAGGNRVIWFEAPAAVARTSRLRVRLRYRA